MSQSGLQRAQHALNVIGRNWESISMTSEQPGVNMPNHLYGVLQRAGLGAEVGPIVMALAGLIGAPTPVETAPESKQPQIAGVVETGTDTPTTVVRAAPV